MQITPIHQIQGSGFISPLSGQEITTRGVVTGRTKRGFFIQDPDGDTQDAVSHGIFVYERRGKPPVGSLVEVQGRAVDYSPDENARPTTQIEERDTRVLHEKGAHIEPVWLTAERVMVSHKRLSELLNSLEGMLVGVPAGSTFVAPSNPFGDYVVLPPGAAGTRTQYGGMLIDPKRPEVWMPGFRVLEYADAPRVHVGSELLEAVSGPLNFRVASYQIAATGPVRVKESVVELTSTTLQSERNSVTVLTLNGFNLDAHHERKEHVNDPRRDVDDDLGDGRFDGLASAVVRDAASPDIIALQEIQDNDGAELSSVVSADKTLNQLVRAIRRVGGPQYQWAEVPPEADADGGQPGGNIRNAFLFLPKRVSLVEGSLRRLAEDSEAYDDSRKPLVARFRLREHAGELEIVNVHLTSKRGQNGLFAPVDPGLDPRLELRVRQANLIGEHMASLRAEEVDYYITGDFNDFEFSETLQTLIGDHSTNLVERVPVEMRFDYNHRGLSQALMHGVVGNRQLAERRAEYEILHANALLGTRPGKRGEKASDHGYVIARLELS
ncbi:MAG: putative extracellular nuclease [Planctomycetota bacterium]|jgi:predicted extracellular nuclease